MSDVTLAIPISSTQQLDFGRLAEQKLREKGIVFGKDKLVIAREFYVTYNTDDTDGKVRER